MQLWKFIIVISIKNNVSKKNKNSNDEKKQKKRDRSNKIKLTILKLATNVFSQFILLISIIVFNIGVYIIILAINDFKCDAFFNELMYYVGYAQLGFVIIIYIIGMCYDILLNFKILIKCGLREFFIENDPIRYRFEYIFSSIAAFLFLLTFLFELLIIQEAVIIAYTLQVFVFYYSSVFVTFFFTLHRAIKKTFRKKVDKAIIDIIIKDKKAKKLFQKYSKQEWNEENFLCYVDIATYEKYKKFENKSRKAIEILELYLNGMSSIREINTTKKIREEVKDKILNKHDFTNELFKDIKTDLKINLSDVINRFILTQEYLNLLKELEQKQEVLKVKSELVRSLSFKNIDPNQKKIKFIR